MLITLPFAGTIWLGSRELNSDGTASQSVRPASWLSMKDGIRVEDNLPMSSYIMMATSLTFLIIQIPAFLYISDKPDRVSAEHTPALIGLVVSILMFIAYSVYQLTSASASERQKEKEQEAKMRKWKQAMKGRFTKTDRILKLVFKKFDTDGSGAIELDELKDGLATLGLKLERKDLMNFMEKYDKDRTFSICMNEFSSLAQDVFYGNVQRLTAANLIAAEQSQEKALTGERQPLINPNTKADGYETLAEPPKMMDIAAANSSDATQEEIDHVENAFSPVQSDAEEEDDFLELTDTQLRNKALILLLAGTVLVTVFSDPMVEAISAFATTTGIPAFYVSFVVTPLASNASEVIASLRFAQKKSVNCVTLSLSSLYGAACMNNTFCLSIFFALIWLQNLEWDFTAETITLLFVTWIVGLNGLKPFYRNYQGFYISALYVLAVIMIASLTFLDK